MKLKTYLIKNTIAIVAGILAASGTTKEDATIRVLLMTSGYGGYYHETVDYQELEDGRFQVLSIERSQGHPIYEGALEVKETDKGYLLINEVPVEDYLNYVVPSEMPTSYEMEALKAQAICARTYAYHQIAERSLAEYGADVDDSVSFQVYNNQDSSERTNEAVEETKGEIMTYEGKPITAYFFSTSAGSTSTDEVWVEAVAPCLKSVSSEFESGEPWYRWNVTFSIEDLEHLFANAGYDIGRMRDIQVTKRSQGGAAISCTFVGEKKTISIENEYTIRSILSPKGHEIHRQDGSIVTNFSLLPSAYFTCAPVYSGNQITGFSFEGGGYGHGVGMSQNGANAMAKNGSTYEEILRYYYEGFTLETR